MSDFDPKQFLSTVPHNSGVYRMYDANGTIIYVGKAKDLKKRLSSYFRANLASRKTEALVVQIAHIDTTITHSETDQLYTTLLTLCTEKPVTGKSFPDKTNQQASLFFTCVVIS